MKTMKDYMAVQESTEGIIGRFFYYSLSGILIKKTKLAEIGMGFGLPKVQPARDSKSGAYRRATTALKERVVTKDSSGPHIWRVACHDNRQDNTNGMCRELVKETLESETNDYRKLANITFDKETEAVDFTNLEYDPDVDARAYCDKALELYELYCTCYTADHVNSVVQALLDQMEANKISIHGNLYFIPNKHLSELTMLEDYIEAVGEYNMAENAKIVVNSMDVVDAERQRVKMAQEFYINYRRDIETYQNAIQQFINNGCDSSAVINRWLLKIQTLQDKKHTYEDVLKRQLNDLDSDFDMLQMQADELRVRNISGQTTIMDVAA